MAQIFEPGAFSYVETLKKNGAAEVEISVRDFPRDTFNISSSSAGVLYIIQHSGYKIDIQQANYEDWASVLQQLNGWVAALQNKPKHKSPLSAIFDFVSQRLMPKDLFASTVAIGSHDIKTESAIKIDAYRESYFLCN